MPGRLTFTMLDHDRERSSTSIHTGDVTAVSLPGLLTEVGALREAIDGITWGTVAKESLTAFDTNLSQDIPLDKAAQRETKWLVVYEDITRFFDDPVNAIPNQGAGKLFNLEIGTANLDLLVTGTGLMDTSTDEYADFVAAFEQTARSPYGGRVRVVEIRHMGRNT